MCLLASDFGRAETFAIRLDERVEPGSPAPGAGSLDAESFTDSYTFEAVSGQIVFFEEISVAPALQNWLRWEAVAPDGQKLFSQLFALSGVGRRVLNQTGAYSIRFFTTPNDPARVGDYAFRLRGIPPDQAFELEVGSTVGADIPAAGAGRLEVAGAQDRYTFYGTAGQCVFLEEISLAAALVGSLRWECTAPSGRTVFTSLYRLRGAGRISLTETGIHTIRLFVADANPTHFGEYAFRLRAIPPDPTFALEANGTVKPGLPGPGAGSLEVPGAWDLYTFSGTADQSVFFEETSVASSLAGALRWECRIPGGQTLFAGLFQLGGVGRKTLPENGTYTIRCFVSDNDPEHLGEYGFRLTTIQFEASYGIRVGDLIDEGQSAPGTGRIETAGSQDLYTFSASAGQNVVFEALSAAVVFAGSLRWEAKTPGGQTIFDRLFQPGLAVQQYLPETGIYVLRVFAGDNDPNHVGGYSFRTFSEVQARPDRFATEPDTPLLMPVESFFCNDQHESTDVVDVELLDNATSQGGTVGRTPDGVLYQPAPGFVGVDEFEYRLRGSYGGQSLARVSITVVDGADQSPALVSLSRIGPSSAELCLLGLPSQAYEVLESIDLKDWSTRETVTANESGRITFTYVPDSAPRRFYRFRRFPPSVAP